MKSLYTILSYMALAAIIAFFLLKSIPVYATNDNEGPVLSDFRLKESGQTLTVGDTIHVTIKVADASEIASVTAFSTGPIAVFTYNDNTGFWEWAYTITENDQDGAFGIESIWAYDRYNNKSNTQMPSERVTLIGCASDKIGPVLSNFELKESGKTLTVGDAIHATIKATDESGVESVTAFSTGPIATFTYNDKTGFWEWSYIITENDQDGAFGIESIWAYDRYNNKSNTLMPSERAMLVGCATDKNGPELSNFKFKENGQTLTDGDTIHVTIKVTDESAVQSVTAFSTGPIATFTYNDNTGFWEWTYVLNESTHEGYFKIESIWAYDEYGNKSIVFYPDDYVIYVDKGHSHIWDNGRVIRNPSCTKDGLILYTCTVDGAKKEEIIPASHTWDTEFKLDYPSSCGKEGQESIHCIICDTIKKGSEKNIEASSNHIWGEWIVVSVPSCSTEGIKEKVCVECGRKEIEVIPVTGTHKYANWIVTKEATCAAEGIKERVCEKCGQKETEAISVTGKHKWSEWSVEREATCEKNGLNVRTCSGCGNKEEKNIPATGHKWGEWTVLTPATAEKEGVEVRICENDSSHVESRNTDKKEDTAKVTSIKIKANPSTTICAGKKVKLSATISPKNALQTVTWKSSNKNYASVTSKGVVTTKKAGIGKTVTITAKAKDGSGKTAKIRIKIVKDGVTKITLKGKTSRPAGKQLTIKATVTAGKTANTELKWTSSNKEYATVNNNGVVTLKEAGKGKYVRIIAMATDGTGVKGSIKIKIT